MGAMVELAEKVLNPSPRIPLPEKERKTNEKYSQSVASYMELPHRRQPLLATVNKLEYRNTLAHRSWYRPIYVRARASPEDTPRPDHSEYLPYEARRTISTWKRKTFLDFYVQPALC